MPHPLFVADSPVTWPLYIATAVVTFFGGAPLWGYIQSRRSRGDKLRDDQVADDKERRSGEDKVRIAELDVQVKLTESEAKVRHTLREEFNDRLLKYEVRLDAVERERDIFKWAYCQLYYAARAIQSQSKAAHDYLHERFPDDPRWKITEVPLDGMTPETLISRANPAVTVNVAVPTGDPRKTTAQISINPDGTGK